MLIVDELKKNDPQLRLVAILLAGGFFILLVGLWWVQVVSAREYQAHLDTQAYRTIRIPAVRGKILDREGRVLAENRPRYNLSLYLDDLRKQFADAIRDLTKQALAQQKQAIAAQEKKLGRSLTKAERKQFSFTSEYVERLHDQARDEVAANVVAQISHNMGEEIPFDSQKFNRHYAMELAMPYPIMENLTNQQIARFQENFTGAWERIWNCSPCGVIRWAPWRRICWASCGRTTVPLLGEESFFQLSPARLSRPDGDRTRVQ